MRSFFKTFFAVLLALAVFTFLLFLLLAGAARSFADDEKGEIADRSVLVIDLANRFAEHNVNQPFNALGGGKTPTLFEVVRLIGEAKNDDNIRGIWLSLDGNANSFASSNELSTALLDFKASKKFVIAYGNNVSEYGYYVGNVADKVYVNPVGGLEWSGFSVSLPFLKGTLEKLNIQPQIFYAGKFKSATEIFRTEKMTPENRLQTEEWLGDLYRHFLQQTAARRNLDTATLYRLAAESAIQTPQDAVNARLIDGAKYDDEVRDEIKKKLSLERDDRLSLVSLSDYNDAVTIRKAGKDKVAVIFAEGDIVDGEGGNDQIGGETFRALVRKARFDNAVKAIVLRVNSGGGSSTLR